MTRRLMDALCWLDSHRYEVLITALVLACLVGLQVTNKGLPD